MITAEIARTEESPSSGERSGTRGRGSLVCVLAGKSEIESKYPPLFGVKLTNSKQLLDEVEHDIMNYQNRGLCYLPKPKAEADNTDARSIACELDMINAITAADIAFIMSSSQAIVN